MLCVVEGLMPGTNCAVEVAFILRLHFYASWVGRRVSSGAAHGGAVHWGVRHMAVQYVGCGAWGAVHRGGAQGEAATQKARKKHEPGHMPVAAPAMLEGYASTRPPRTAHRAPAGRRHPIRKDQR